MQNKIFLMKIPLSIIIQVEEWAINILELCKKDPDS